MAVPKKKVSYSRKRMKLSNKGHKKVFYTKCSVCHKYKRMHHSHICCD